VLAAGCAAQHSQLEQALLADRNPAAHGGDAGVRYHVHCPDVLRLQVPGPAEVKCRVRADGRIDLGPPGTVRVDGHTTAEIAREVAGLLGVPEARVAARVAEYRSQQVYLFGEVTGTQRALPYRGPETVLDLLQRAGGLTPGAAPGDVQVVRPHVADGKTPEVFQVHLADILRQNDQSSNVRLEPFDQVYVGQSSPSRLCPCVPPWLRPAYETLCGMRRPGAASPQSGPAGPTVLADPSAPPGRTREREGR
jgi:protein involved in polysaccharide export with SLBB domain